MRSGRSASVEFWISCSGGFAAVGFQANVLETSMGYPRAETRGVGGEVHEERYWDAEPASLQVGVVLDDQLDPMETQHIRPAEACGFLGGEILDVEYLPAKAV